MNFWEPRGTATVAMLGQVGLRGQAEGIETQVAIQAVCAWPNRMDP